MSKTRSRELCGNTGSKSFDLWAGRWELYFGLVLHELAGAKNRNSNIYVPCKMQDLQTLTESQSKTLETIQQ